jgi:replicative DNA helicase
LPTLFFELELPSELMFERFVQMEKDQTADEVENHYRSNGAGIWKQFRNLNHIMVCGESGLTTTQIESFIYRSELKGGMKPAVVIVDYIGLIRGETCRSRYEKLSATAEEMKVIAKRTRTIIVLGTQVARPDKSKPSLEPKLHDAKDSGSIENSAGLVLGAWRPDHGTMMIKVLKNTKGKSGMTIECNFDGEKMHLSERTQGNHYAI